MSIKQVSAFTTQPGEIAGLTEKTPLVDADVLLLEDSAASYADKKITRGNLFKNIATITIADGGTIGLGSGKGLIQFDDETVDTLSFLNCRIGIGTSTPEDILHLAASNSDVYTQFDLYDDSNATQPYFLFRRSLSDTIGTKVATTNGTALALLGFKGVNSGTNFAYGVAIRSVQDGAAGASYVPTNLIFETCSGTVYNSNQLVLHNDGNIGIGTISPSYLLDAQYAGGNLYVRIYNTANADTVGYLCQSTSVGGTGRTWFSGIYSDGKYSIRDVSAGADRMTIDTSGNIGIGAISPSGLLHARKGAANLNIYLDCFSDDSTNKTIFNIRKTHHDSPGSYSATVDGESLAAFYFYGSTAGGFVSAATIDIQQSGDAGASYIPTLIQFATSDGTAAPTARFSISKDGNVACGPNASLASRNGLDIQSGGWSLILGADSMASTRTNTTNKVGRIGSVHYTNAEEPVAMLYATNVNGDNALMIGGGTGEFNAATYLALYTAANSTTTTGTERVRITSDGRVGINTTTPGGDYGLDISSGDITLILGADSGTKTRTDSTNKIAKVGYYPYTNAEEKVCMIVGTSKTSDNIVEIGGSGETSVFNSSTVIKFYTAANTTTLGGSERMRILSDGKVGIGTNSPQSLLDVAGDIYPTTDNTYYLGRNSISTPKAYKGVVLKDTTNGNYYRIEIINGVITATQIT